MSEVYSPETVAHAPWSLTKAHTAIQCPLKFHLRHVVCNKAAAAKGSRSAAIGKAVHAALEWALSNKFGIRDALQRAVLKEKLTSVEMDVVFALAYNMQRFMTKLDKFSSERGVQERYVEKRFGLNKDLDATEFFGDDVFFRGVWDLCLKTSNGYLIIIDHKSGKEGPVETHQEQLMMYAVAGLKVFGDDILGVQPALHFVSREEGLVWDTMYKSEKIRDELQPWFVGLLNKAGANTKSRIPNRGFWCSYCEYAKACPLQQ